MHVEALRGSFHDAIGPVLRVSQFFGLMPVDGVNSNDISNINFRWKSIKSIYALVFLACGSVECLLCLRLAAISGMTLGFSSALSFYATSMFGAFYLLKLASKWQHLMTFWYKCEKVFLKPPYIIRGWSLKQKIRLWAASIGLFSLCKEILNSHL